MANVTETARWDTGVYQIEKSDKVLGGADGKVNVQAQQLANRTAYLKQQVEAKANSDSPIFTGTPTAPTAPQTANNTQIATTAYVRTAIAALVGSAPETLDTLVEIATALGSDGNLKATLLTEIGKKANASDFSNLKNLLVGIPFPYPLAAVPSGCLAFNGQAFNKTTYPILAQKYPSGVLPDLRGEFIRFWDNGRGVDSGRALLSAQGDAIRNITGFFCDIMYQDLSMSTTSGAFYSNLEITNAKFAVSDTSNIRTSGSPMASNAYAASNKGDFIGFDSNRVVPTATENRPRNIAFQAICLAA